MAEGMPALGLLRPDDPEDPLASLALMRSEALARAGFFLPLSPSSSTSGSALLRLAEPAPFPATWACRELNSHNKRMTTLKRAYFLIVNDVNQQQTIKKVEFQKRKKKKKKRYLRVVAKRKQMISLGLARITIAAQVSPF